MYGSMVVLSPHSFCLLHGFSHLRFPYRSLGNFQPMSFCSNVFRSVSVAQQQFHIISFPRPDVWTWTEITLPRPRRPRPGQVSHMIFFADPLNPSVSLSLSFDTYTTLGKAAGLSFSSSVQVQLFPSDKTTPRSQIATLKSSCH